MLRQPLNHLAHCVPSRVELNGRIVEEGAEVSQILEFAIMLECLVVPLGLLKKLTFLTFRSSSLRLSLQQLVRRPASQPP